MSQSTKHFTYFSLSALTSYFWYLLALSPVVTLSSCSKTLPPVDTIIKPIDTAALLNYQPMTTGSTWYYAGNASGFGVTFNLFCTNRDTTLMDSKVYRVYDNDYNPKYSEYHRIEDTFKYWSIVPLSTNKTPLLILKSNAKIGERWVGAVNGDETYIHQMISKNIDYKVDSFTYKNVIHVYQTRINTSNDTNFRSNIYFAAGIGVVHITGELELKLIKAVIK